MSVLINMKMPETCFECNFCIVRSQDIHPHCQCFLLGGAILDLYSAKTAKLSSEVCPLIEIPDRKMFLVKDGFLYTVKCSTPKDAQSITMPEWREQT